MRTRSAHIVCATVLVACAGLAGEAEFVAPTSLEAHDTPNDAGGGICLTWPRSPSESDQWDYVVFAATVTAGPWKEVQRFASTARLKGDMPDVYGFSRTHRDWHATEVRRAEVFEPAKLTALRAMARNAANEHAALSDYRRARRAILRLQDKHGRLDALEKKLAELGKQIDAIGQPTDEGRKARLRRLEGQRGRLGRDKSQWTQFEQAAEQAKQAYRRLTAKEIESVKRIAPELGRLETLRRDLEHEIKQLVRESDLSRCCFRLAAARRGAAASAEPFAGLLARAAARPNVFNRADANTFVVTIGISIVILGSIAAARRREFYLRKIAGLDAVDEALGRCTEMGKPALFVHGLTGVSDIAVIASVNILGRMARRVAEYDTPLLVVNNEPVVYSLSSEVVREGFVEAGRPDRFREDHIVMVASRQFPYVAAVAGIMARERPAANFFMGYFYAESLILAESGAATGAIQIAGTDAFTQLPFFVTTCDYTLMGEELYAASAYLSREPKLVGTLRGQDIGKAILIVVLFVGTAWESLLLLAQRFAPGLLARFDDPHFLIHLLKTF